MAQTPSAHKPRRRRNDDDKFIVQSGASTPGAPNLPRIKEPSFPLEAFFWPARHGVSQWIVLPSVLMIVGLFRWSAGFWGYSGFQSPPMHGDFEAQRHWMELTTQVSVSEWYFHDLEWWGLDYPPLTAYHSWVLGKIGALFNPSWFALYSSRGLDDALLKVYMRATVMVSEYAVYMPALILFCRQVGRLQQINEWTQSIALAAILMQPGTILIDHAHFQYNTVMLGFVVASMTGLLHGAFFSSCVFFVAALGFKQMALYYAPAVFAYLLGSCFFPRVNLIRFLSIASVTAISFVCLFSPLLLGALYDAYTGPTTDLRSPPPTMEFLNLNANGIYYSVVVQLAQAIHRIFPFARGLFEDKVANFWCAAHTFHKLNRYPTQLLQRLSLGMTLASIGPPCLLAFLYPRRNIVLPAFAATSWAFFLFSFQVHEKSVLLPLLPMTLMLCTIDGLRPSTRAWVSWANILGCWTMYPLLKRDQLRVPYFVLTLLWAWLLGVPPMVARMIYSSNSKWSDCLIGALHAVFYIAMILWHMLEALVQPPATKPDLWVVLNVLIGAPGFAICYAWCLWKMWDGLPSTKGRERAKAKIT